MFYAFLESTFWSSAPSGWLELFTGQTPPPSQRYRLRLFREFVTTPPLVVATNAGMTLELNDSRDALTFGLLPLKLAFTLVVQVGLSVAMIYPTGAQPDRDVRVEVDRITSTTNVEPVFRGWLLAADAREEYSGGPYTVSFSASCGLSTLKTRPVVTQEGIYPTGKLSIKEVLEGLLWQAGLGLNLTSVCNLTAYADRSSPAGADPLTRELIDGDVFRPAGDEPPSAWEVLERVCKKKRAFLVQWQGRWWYVRRNELPGGWIPTGVDGATSEQAYVRYYGQAGKYNVEAVRQLKNFTTLCGPGYPLRVLSGGSTEPQPPEVQVSVEQKLGPTKSLLPNGDFAVEGVYGPTGLPSGWRYTNDAYTTGKRVGTGKPDDPWAIQLDGTGSLAIPIYGEVNGVFAVIEFPAGTRRIPAYRLNGIFKGKNIRGANIQVIMALSGPITRSPAGHIGKSAPDWCLLNEDGSWMPGPPRSERYGIELVNVNKVGEVEYARTDEADIDIALNSYELPPLILSEATILRIEIKLCQATPLAGSQPAERWIRYAKMRLVPEGANQYTGRRYTVVNQVIPASNLKAPEHNGITLEYGDASFSGFGESEGMLYMINALGNPTPALGYDKPDVPTTASAGAPLAAWLALEEAAQVATVTHRFDGELIGELPWGPLTVLRFADWTAAARCGLTRFSWDIPNMTYRNLSALEIHRTPVGTLTGVYLLDDGGELPFTAEVPGGSDATDNFTPIPPKKAATLITQDQWRSRDVLPVPHYVAGPRFLDDAMPIEPAEQARAPVFNVYEGSPQLGKLLASLPALVRKLTAIPSKL